MSGRRRPRQTLRTILSFPISRPSHQHRFSSSAASRKRPARLAIPLAIAAAGIGIYYLSQPPRKNTNLNQSTFAPYTIISTERISPTSAILSVLPQQNSVPPYLLPGSSTWRWPLWSVEFKQPEVQIARHYTPLPSLPNDDPRDGKLRFYVRGVPGGEMSNYLQRLRDGHDVYLRGPHEGFDILGRLGKERKVVFLAGGTGLVPGMQVAKAALESDDSATVTLLWAVRKRDEVQNRQPRQVPWWTTLQPEVLGADLADPSPISEHLLQLKRAYGDRLTVRVSVDEEKTSFKEKDVAAAMGTMGKRRLSDTVCNLHSQERHRHSSEFESGSPICTQGCEGKNLLMVSGPDGFIAHYAGEKVWLAGTLTQGRVGGIAARLRDAGYGSDWLVLKL